MRKSKNYRFEYTEESHKATCILVIVFCGIIHTTESKKADRYEVEIERVLYKGSDILQVYQAHDENALDGIENACRQHLFENDYYDTDKAHSERFGTIHTAFAA
jgi:hypothetical protein